MDDYLDQWLNYYECPACDHHWYDVWDSQVDDQCPECRTPDISPTNSYELADGGIPVAADDELQGKLNAINNIKEVHPSWGSSDDFRDGWKACLDLVAEVQETESMSMRLDEI